MAETTARLTLSADDHMTVLRSTTGVPYLAVPVGPRRVSTIDFGTSKAEGLAILRALVAAVEALPEWCDACGEIGCRGRHAENPPEAGRCEPLPAPTEIVTAP